MRQIVLPFADDPGRAPSRIIVGNANAAAIAAFSRAVDWPFRTAILAGPPRAGKSLLARWFVDSGAGDAIDDAARLDEAELFHRWNRAQENARPLLLVTAIDDGWSPKLPDLASRLGAALRLEIGAPDDVMLAELLALHAHARGLVLDSAAFAYLVPRCERSHIGAEQLVIAIDRLSLERKVPPSLSIWRAALEEQADATGRSRQIGDG